MYWRDALYIEEAGYRLLTLMIIRNQATPNDAPAGTRLASKQTGDRKIHRKNINEDRK
jgi:hypothetical protein